MPGFEEITKFCSSLSKIFLDTPEPGVLDHIHRLQHIRNLKFNKVESEDLVQTLRGMSYKITSIDLVNCGGYLDLGELSCLCPNLVNIEIYYSKNVISKNSVKFPNLRKIVIYATELSSDAANDILENSPNVEHITLNSASSLDYSRLVNIVNRNLLAHVSELALMSAPLLDIQCLELLIHRLDKLQIVGRLEGWNITTDQLEYLRKKVKKENYDLTLWYNLPLHVELGMDQDIIDL